MTKLRSMAVVAVLAAFATTAQAQDGSYNTKYGMIFSLNNIFQRDGILSGAGANGDSKNVAGAVGVQYTLSATRALRLVASLSRTSNPPYETETTQLNTGVTTKSYWHPAGNTSETDVGLGGSFIMRFTNAALSPYLGVGAGLSFAQDISNWEDSISSTTQTTARDYTARTIGLNGLGQLGVEWRVHKAIAIFAEYGLTLDVVKYTSSSDSNPTTQKATGVVTGQKVESSHMTWLNFGTGLVQGGSLGVIAFF